MSPAHPSNGQPSQYSQEGTLHFLTSTFIFVPLILRPYVFFAFLLLEFPQPHCSQCPSLTIPFSRASRTVTLLLKVNKERRKRVCVTSSSVPSDVSKFISCPPIRGPYEEVIMWLIPTKLDFTTGLELEGSKQVQVQKKKKKAKQTNKNPTKPELCVKQGNPKMQIGNAQALLSSFGGHREVYLSRLFYEELRPGGKFCCFLSPWVGGLLTQPLRAAP